MHSVSTSDRVRFSLDPSEPFTRGCPWVDERGKQDDALDRSGLDVETQQAKTGRSSWMRSASGHVAGQAAWPCYGHSELPLRFKLTIIAAPLTGAPRRHHISVLTLRPHLGGPDLGQRHRPDSGDDTQLEYRTILSSLLTTSALHLHFSTGSAHSDTHTLV